jgi:glycosyltransferase involved in cell wall biosynthesis
MIAKDEKGFLENCLESVKDLVDEIIVVDTGSSDDTKQIAAGFGAKVSEIKWKDDFSIARNISLDKAKSNWILVLDADEMLDAQGKEKILKLINDRDNCLAEVIGFKMDQQTYMLREGRMGMITTDPGELKKEYHSPESSKLVRLFKNTPKIRFRNKVHELVEPSIKQNGGRIIDTDIVIHHFSHVKKDKLTGKLSKYTDLMWKQLEEEPENPRYNRQVATAFLDEGNKELALKYFLRTLKFDPEYPAIYKDLGKLYLEMGQVKKAVRLFNMAIAKDKKDVSSMNNLAVIYMKSGKQDIARELLEKAISVEPENKCLLSNYEKLKKNM